jgi:predicted transcriptional regulator
MKIDSSSIEKLKNISQFKEVPNQINGECFACGQAHSSGLKMKFHTDNLEVFSKLRIPSYLNGWSKITHGGITTTILDETLAWVIIYLKQSFMLTKSISVDFLKPIKVETEVYSIGRIKNEISKREFSVEAEIYDSNFELAAKSIGNIILMNKDSLLKRNIVSEDFLNQFSNSVFKGVNK